MASDHMNPAVTEPTSGEDSGVDSSRKRRRFSLRGFTSLLLTLAFLAMCVSGTMLFLTPRGRTANWTDWTLAGLTKHQWSSVHVNNSVIFVTVAVLHLILNWAVFWHYLKSKTASGINMRKELALAMVVAAICIGGPIADLPPFRNMMTLNEDIKNYWDSNSQQPPVPHAEEMTLADLAGTIDLSTEQMLTALREEGYEAAGAEQTIGAIAESKGLAPNAVFEAIRQRYPSTHGWGRVTGRGAGGGGGGGGKKAGGGGHGSAKPSEAGATGSGRGGGQVRSWQSSGSLEEVTLADIAQAVGLSEDEVLAALLDAGYLPDNSETSLSQLGDQQGTSPPEVLQAIRDRFPDTRGWGRLGR